MAHELVESIRGEYLRYKSLGDATIQQLRDDDLSRPAHDEGNSVATIVWHVSGNLTSRFTDFLTSDGEKPWRHRDEEFERRHVSREALIAKWSEGWKVLFAALTPLTDDQLERMRRVSLAEHVRWKLGMSQSDFAQAFHIPIGTLRDWEQHRCEPDQAAQSYLKVIARNPKAVRRALEPAA